MAKVIGATKVTGKFQITLTEAVRKLLDLKVGDTVVYVEENGKVYITCKVEI